MHAEWGSGDAGGGGEYYQCYVSAGGDGGGEVEREREREEGVGEGMGGSPSLTDLEVDDMVDTYYCGVVRGVSSKRWWDGAFRLDIFNLSEVSMREATVWKARPGRRQHV